MGQQHRFVLNTMPVLFTNSGTVVFDPHNNNCFWGTYTVDVIAATQFNHVTINAGGSCGTYANPVTASGDIAAAAGDFVHNDGYITGQSLVLQVILP